MIQDLVSDYFPPSYYSGDKFHFLCITGCVQSKKHCTNCVTGAAAAVAVGIRDLKFSEKIPEHIYHDRAQLDERFGLDKSKLPQHTHI